MMIYNLMDIRLVSTLGLTDEDVNDIKNIKGVDRSISNILFRCYINI